MFKYIEGSLEKIKNPENVIMIRTCRKKGGHFLCAYLKSGEEVELTKTKTYMTYPFAPFKYLSGNLDKNFWQDMVVLFDDIAINNQYLKKFIYCNSLDDAKRYDLFVYFTNNTHYMLAQPQKKYFFDKMYPEMLSKFDVEIEQAGTGLLID